MKPYKLHNKKQTNQLSKINQYNEKVHGNDIVNGDRVLSQNSSETGGTGKLQAHWENNLSSCRKGGQLNSP